MNRFVAVLILIITSGITASAEPKTFRNEGLKLSTVVVLDVQKHRVTGTFAASEYGEEAEQKYPFTGEVIATKKDKHGVYMRIRFDGTVPYSPPPRSKTIEWFLKIVNHRAHLFIPMQERSYEGKTPKWIVSDVEFISAD
jgi:hypothetical protein